ncbi:MULTISPECIES: AbrB family transcriptional regulator [Methylobacterium]|uniref:AbrB family transcriptional regulator n=1 Tax=Methylobacterium TaxID=407 RepID=UPI0013ED0576|nr:AbrB family transcriptional regulator [Methylobacterium sp. DB0501]NGM35860.1 AbrB family transcriptional regulator [Methylobacterium sp. DB0501]
MQPASTDPHRSLPRAAALWAGLVAASGALAGLFHLAGFPAALLLGPMLAAIVFGVRGAPIRVPKLGFQASQALIGCLVAHAVNASIAATLIEDGFLILAVVGVTVVAAAMAGWILTRIRLLPGTTAAWGSSPGGASAMVAMAEDFGADPRLVAFMQYVRVACVALTASVVARFLAGDPGAAPPGSDMEAGPLAVAGTLAVAGIGAWLGLRLRVPAGALIGPLAIGATLHATGLAGMALPSWLLALAYAGIGWTVGLRFTPATVRATLFALPGVLVATFGLIGLCGLWAWGLTFWLPIDLLTAYLATSPGGLDSVAIIAVGTHSDVSFVLAVQTLRLLVVIITGPLVAKWISRGAGEAR